MNRTLLIFVFCLVAAANLWSAAFLGIYLGKMPEDAENGKPTKGVYISGLVEDGPAEKAGISAKEIVIEIDGKKVDDGDGMRRILADLDNDDKVKVKTTDLKGDKREYEVVLSRRPNVKVQNQFGVTVRQLDSGFTWDGIKHGMLVTNVKDDSPAKKAGLKPGDVIQKIGDNKVGTLTKMSRALAVVEIGQKVKVDLIRDKKDKSLMIGVMQVEVETTPSYNSSYSYSYSGTGAPPIMLINGGKFTADVNPDSIGVWVQSFTGDEKTRAFIWNETTTGEDGKSATSKVVIVNPDGSGGSTTINLAGSEEDIKKLLDELDWDDITNMEDLHKLKKELKELKEELRIEIEDIKGIKKDHK